MTTINNITANPTRINAGGVSIITVNATTDDVNQDTSYRIVGTVEGTGEAAEVTVVLRTSQPGTVVYRLPGETANPGDIRLSLPNGGTLTRTANPNQFEFRA